MNYWYAYVKANISAYSSLASSASAITELGSVMGNEKKKLNFLIHPVNLNNEFRVYFILKL